MGDFYKCDKCGKTVKVVYEGAGVLSCCGQPMKKVAGFGTVDEALGYASEKEQEAHDFYHELSAKADKQWVRDLLEDFAREELGHKGKLNRVRDGKMLTPSPKQVADLKISVRSRFSDVLVTVLTVGIVVPRTVTYEGVVVGR